MSTTIDVLTSTVSKAVREGSLSKEIGEIKIEPDVDAQGNEIIRILVELKRQPKNVDDQLEDLLERIETAILAIDERYPSVRFLDAA